MAAALIDLHALRAEMIRAGDTAEQAFVLFGSAVLYLHGLRDDIGDVDLFVRPWLYERLKARGWEEQRPHPADPPLLKRSGSVVGRDLQAFYAWTDRDPWVDAEATFASREVVDGLPCASLVAVARHKHGALMQLAAEGVEIEGTRWEKHERDLRALSSHGVQWLAA